MYLADSFKNPFSDYNANTLNATEVVNLWENPFGTLLMNISEEDIANEKTPIMFTGGRGSGKTMVLKNHAIDAQIKRAQIANKDYIKSIKDDGYIGLYIRFDSPLLQGFKGLGKNNDQWEAIFTHFFELTVCKTYVDALIKVWHDQPFPHDLLSELNTCLGYTCGSESTLSDTLSLVNQDINYVNRYRSEVVFGNVEFSPTRIMPFGSLTQVLPRIVKKAFDDEDLNNLVLIDEYENFLPYQQRIVNSAVKFSHGVAFRIGMRPSGFHTFDTISENEHIKESRDYRNVRVDNPLIRKDGSGYVNFLVAIAHKRLLQIDIFKKNNLLDIQTFLGQHENCEEEARKIVRNRTRHFDVYLREIKKEADRSGISFDTTDPLLQRLHYPENPLYEMQNLHLLLLKLDLPFVVKAFEDYKNGVKSAESHKYQNDYVNKYKLSYLFVLCSIYKVEKKLYYSFSDYAALSSGIVGTFIELCRNAFQYAAFENMSELLKGRISPEIQTRAAYDVSQSEMEQINRIKGVGTKVYALCRYFGQKFSDLHTDKRIRYPETNQFSFDPTRLLDSTEEKEVFNAAERWSVIQSKGLQQASIGESDQQVFVLNRIYSPQFGISCRTRGGYNEKLSIEILKKICGSNSVSAAEKDDSQLFEQLRLYDNTEESLDE